jgi:hypothetical protein
MTSDANFNSIESHNCTAARHDSRIVNMNAAHGKKYIQISPTKKPSFFTYDLLYLSVGDYCSWPHELTHKGLQQTWLSSWQSQTDKVHHVHALLNFSRVLETINIKGHSEKASYKIFELHANNAMDQLDSLLSSKDNLAQVIGMKQTLPKLLICTKRLLESTVGSFADQPSEMNTCEKITKQWNWRVGLRCERLSSLFCFLSLLLCKEYK